MLNRDNFPRTIIAPYSRSNKQLFSGQRELFVPCKLVFKLSTLIFCHIDYASILIKLLLIG